MSTAVLLVLPIALVLAALTDFLEMKIPNAIPVLMIVSFLFAAPFTGLSLAEFGWNLAAAAIVFFACFALFAINVMGGGDAKLLTATALWFGFNHALFEFLVVTAFFGGILTIFIILLRANWEKFAIIGVPLPRALMSANKVPYGIAIGAAGLMTYPQAPIVVAAIKGLGA
ncbi:A24 family peptidase [Peteryoungia ipomoeae]|uniref:Peptidase n=1 Tax=Peteryoungia ipomoeae TaxID=1210932 RepID=A0A4S8P202_9HYPH|nr:prepilin peptidase [Peteryoungia ipomoeae]THV24073.1 peptidase [Peteryoungia ipomoeae]